MGSGVSGVSKICKQTLQLALCLLNGIETEKRAITFLLASVVTVAKYLMGKSASYFEEGNRVSWFVAVLCCFSQITQNWYHK